MGNQQKTKSKETKPGSLKRSVTLISQANQEKKGGDTNYQYQMFITDDPMDIGIIIKQYYEKLHAHKLDDFNEKNQFLERYKLLKLTKEKYIS